MSIKVSDYIAQFLRAQNVDYVFEVAGGMITHLLDAIHQQRSAHIISVHHEQAAAFAADGYGRTTGKAGVAFATSGPGATNLLTGIASCYFDSSPALFITGQVNTFEQKGNRAIRQLGFQETNIVDMAKPVTKKAIQVNCANDIESVFHEAYRCAISDRPGPVLIDLPMDIQRAQIEASDIATIERQIDTSSTSMLDLELVKNAILHAKRPVILYGGGIRAAQAEEEARAFAQLTQIPVVTSLMGLDIFPFDHPQRIGFIGTYGNRFANLALSEADLILVIGSRLDVRQTGADVEGFVGDKTIIHVDCEACEINNRVKGCMSVISDAKVFLMQACAQFATLVMPSLNAWINRIAQLKQQWPDIKELADFSGINPNQFMHALSQASVAARGYVADVGNHQMWAAQSLEVASHQVFLTSGGMGAMGFALPAAIGASLSYGKKPMVVIAGDGAFQMNIQELQTIQRNQIPLKIIVLNNRCLGMIRQFQDSYFEGRYQSTYWGYDAPDFTRVAQAYGIDAKTMQHESDMHDLLNWLWQNPNAPSLLQVMIDPHMNVYPKIAFGKPISEMEPFFKPVGMEST